MGNWVSVWINGLRLSDDDIEDLEKAFPGKIQDYR
jgi:hypothetical protein